MHSVTRKNVLNKMLSSENRDLRIRFVTQYITYECNLRLHDNYRTYDVKIFQLQEKHKWSRRTVLLFTLFWLECKHAITSKIMSIYRWSFLCIKLDEVAQIQLTFSLHWARHKEPTFHDTDLPYYSVKVSVAAWHNKRSCFKRTRIHAMVKNLLEKHAVMFV